MNAKDTIFTAYDFADRVVQKYLEGLTDEQLMTRPVVGMNHVAWQLGHLISSERALLESVRPGSSPALPEGFDEAHGRGEDSTGSNDPGRFSTKARYLELMAVQRAATRDAVLSMAESDLDAPAPERLRGRVPTVGAVLLLIGTHYLMHTGQWVAVRRKHGLPVAI